MSNAIEARDRFIQATVSGRATKEDIDKKREELSGGRLVGINYLVEDHPNGTHEIIETRLTFYRNGRGEVEELSVAA